MMLTFALLALSICATWLPSIQFNRKVKLSPWAVIFLFSVLSGLIAGYLRPLALVGLAVLLLFAYLSGREQASRFQRMVFGVLAALVALLMAMHRLPGFNNPVLWTNLKLTADAAPFTLYANFDKGAAGLVLLVFFCRRSANWTELAETLRQALPAVIATLICVPVAAVMVGYIKPELKLSGYTGTFLFVNLFFTIVAEEAFFRGLIQDRVAKSIPRRRSGKAIAVTVSALLFAAAHFAGGGIYVALATLAGFGYSIAYASAQRIEGAIIAHFLLNAMQFIWFTYPFIQH